MTDHNLDDLIIDNIEPKNRKTKSFLTIIALFIVVIIIAIILTRSLLKTQDNNQLILEEDSIELIAPELKLQEKPEKIEKIAEPSLEDIIEKKPKVPEVKIEKPVIIPKPEKIESIKKVEKKEPVIPAPQPIELPKIEEKIPAPVKEEKKEVPVIPKPVEKKPVTQKPITKEQFYVQVGAFNKEPSKRLLSVIKNSGFNRPVIKTDAKGTKKVLIGPYETRAEVDVALKKVKDRINKRAFVIKK